MGWWADMAQRRRLNRAKAQLIDHLRLQAGTILRMAELAQRAKSTSELARIERQAAAFLSAQK